MLESLQEDTSCKIKFEFREEVFYSAWLLWRAAGAASFVWVEGISSSKEMYVTTDVKSSQFTIGFSESGFLHGETLT